MVNGRNLEGEPSKLIARALEIDPNNLKALSLAGTAAYLRKDFPGALRHWEKLAQVAPTATLRARSSVASTRPVGWLAGRWRAQVQAQAPGTAAKPAAASVSGTVTLSKQLAGKAAPDDTVFVFARAAEGCCVCRWRSCASR